MRTPKVRFALACAAVSALGAGAIASPVVQIGNYVASNQAASQVKIIVTSTDPAVTDANSAAAEDIEGMQFTIQLGTGAGSSPSISTVDFNSNTIWTGNISPPLGGVDQIQPSGPQRQFYSVSTAFDTTTNTPVVVNPNGNVANVTLSTAGAALGQIAVTLTLDPTKDPFYTTRFLNGLGDYVPTAVTNGNLTIVSNQVVYWSGATAGNPPAWDTSGNWLAAAAPTAVQDAYFGKPIPSTGATINLSATENVHNLWFDGSYTFNGGQITLAGGTVTVFNGSTAAINSTLAGSAGLTLSAAGGGTLSLGGTSANTYSGDTIVNAGTLILNKTGVVAIPGGNLTVNGSTVQFAAAGQTGNQTAVTLTNGASNAVATIAASQNFGSLAGNGTVGFPGTLGPSLTVGANNTPSTYSGSFTGAGNLIKTGSGVFTVSGSNNSLSAVTVNGGTLAFSTATPNLNATTLGGSWTVNASTLTLPAGNTVTTIAPAASVTLGAPTASFPAINGLTSNQGTFAISGGKTFTTAGALTNDGAILVTGANSALTVSGNLANTNANSASGSVTVDANAALSTNSIKQNSLTINGVVNIAPKASGGGQSIVNSFSLGAGGSLVLQPGRLDLADNSLIVKYSGTSPATTIAGALAEGFGPSLAQRWLGGPGGIISSVAHNDPSHFALGYADGADGVVPQLPAGQVLVKYVRAGDANMDGVVDVVDLGILATHYNHNGNWDQGDYNYDGKVDVVDLGILATNYNKSSSLNAQQAALQLQQDMSLFPAFGAVPEPGAAAIGVVVGMFGLMRRKRRFV